MTPWLLLWLQICCATQGVQPEFALAVFQVESGDRHHTYRFGPLGRKGTYAGPAGLHRAYCREKFGVDPVEPEINIAIGVRALRGADKLRVLRRYNKTCDRAYEQAVFAKMKELKRQAPKGATGY